MLVKKLPKLWFLTPSHQSSKDFLRTHTWPHLLLSTGCAPDSRTAASTQGFSLGVRLQEVTVSGPDTVFHARCADVDLSVANKNSRQRNKLIRLAIWNVYSVPHATEADTHGWCCESKCSSNSGCRWWELSWGVTAWGMFWWLSYYFHISITHLWVYNEKKYSDFWF